MFGESEPGAPLLPPWKWVRVELPEGKTKAKSIPDPHARFQQDPELVAGNHYLADPEVNAEIPFRWPRPDALFPALQDELENPFLRDVWSRRLGLTLAQNKWPVFRVISEMQCLTWEAPSIAPETAQQLGRLAALYVQVRLEGHSTGYALDSQEFGYVPPSEGLEKGARLVLVAYPGIPPARLRKTVGGDYFVVDNGLAWVADADLVRTWAEAGVLDKPTEDTLWIPMERHDAREFDPQFAAAFAAAQTGARAAADAAPDSPNVYSDEFLRILREEHGIESVSHYLLNPHIRCR